MAGSKLENVTVAENEMYDTRCADIWCLGIMLYMMVSGLAPWEMATVDCNEYKSFKEGEISLKEKLESSQCDHWVDPQALGMFLHFLFRLRLRFCVFFLKTRVFGYPEYPRTGVFFFFFFFCIVCGMETN